MDTIIFKTEGLIIVFPIQSAKNYGIWIPSSRQSHMAEVRIQPKNNWILITGSTVGILIKIMLYILKYSAVHTLKS